MMKVEEIDALLGGEAQRLADQYREMPLDFMDGYGWAVTQICRLYHDATPVIKCKDCKYYQQRRNADDWLWCMMNHHYTDEEKYCAWAERKEENGK